MQKYIYNDLLFEIYHYMQKYEILLLNNVSERLAIIYRRIDKYISKDLIYIPLKFWFYCFQKIKDFHIQP